MEKSDDEAAESQSELDFSQRGKQMDFKSLKYYSDYQKTNSNFTLLSLILHCKTLCMSVYVLDNNTISWAANQHIFSFKCTFKCAHFCFYCFVE